MAPAIDIGFSCGTVAPRGAGRSARRLVAENVPGDFSRHFQAFRGTGQCEVGPAGRIGRADFAGMERFEPRPPGAGTATAVFWRLARNLLGGVQPDFS
jgi:hypothetical protein